MKHPIAPHNALDEPCLWCDHRAGWTLYCAPLPEGTPAPEGWRCKGCGGVMVALETQPAVRALLARIQALEAQIAERV